MRYRIDTTEADEKAGYGPLHKKCASLKGCMKAAKDGCVPYHRLTLTEIENGCEDERGTLDEVLALHELYESASRFQDTPAELRIRLKRSLDLRTANIYHEKAPKEEQFITATASKDGKIVDVTIFLNKLPASILAAIKRPRKGSR